MSEPSTADAPAEPQQGTDGPAEVATDQQAPSSSETDWQAEAEKWKSMARKNEERAKANVEKAKAWDDYEDSRKSDQQKQAEALNALQSERDSAHSQLAVLQAITKHGLSAEDADLLGAGTAEEIDQRAQRLAERLKASAPRATPDPALGRERTSAPRTNDWLREQLRSK